MRNLSQAQSCKGKTSGVKKHGASSTCLNYTLEGSLEPRGQKGAKLLVLYIEP
jgi:hypothetical protein